MTTGPLIVQSDKTALLEVDHPQAADARHDLAVFAELELTWLMSPLPWLRG